MIDVAGWHLVGTLIRKCLGALLPADPKVCLWQRTVFQEAIQDSKQFSIGRRQRCFFRPVPTTGFCGRPCSHWSACLCKDGTHYAFAVKPAK